jgi:hypothetical protein
MADVCEEGSLSFGTPRRRFVKKNEINHKGDLIFV